MSDNIIDIAVRVDRRTIPALITVTSDNTLDDDTLTLCRTIYNHLHRIQLP